MSLLQKYVRICGVGTDLNVEIPVESDVDSTNNVLPINNLKTFYPNTLTIYEESDGAIKGLKTHEGNILIQNLIKYEIQLSGLFTENSVFAKF